MKLGDLPAPDKYWERPPKEFTGTDSPEPVYEAVGYALSRWEQLEGAFSYVFSLLIETNSHAAARAYGSLVSNSARRDALSAAAEIYFKAHAITTDEQKQFGRLLDHFGRASGRRNEIAHGIVLFVFENGCFLLPPGYNSNKTRAFVNEQKLKIDPFEILKTEYVYSRNNIVDFGRRFKVMADITIEYFFSLREKYRTPAEGK